MTVKTEASVFITQSVSQFNFLCKWQLHKMMANQNIFHTYYNMHYPSNSCGACWEMQPSCYPNKQKTTAKGLSCSTTLSYLHQALTSFSPILYV